MVKRYEFLSINNQLIWNFRDIGHTMRRIAESKGSQKRILIILSETGPITQSKLTQRLEIQPGSVSEVLGKLEASGLIQREASERDRRTTVVQLTAEGRKIAAEASAQRIQRHLRMFASLTEEEKNTLLSLLEKINADWDRQYRQDGAGQSMCGAQNASH